MPDDEQDTTPSDTRPRRPDQDTPKPVKDADGATPEAGLIRPTKKQQQLLEFIRLFVIEHGYGPSYREIMTGCNYTSVATVAVHVKNLIARGHLHKKGRSARSLEIVGEHISTKTRLPTNEIKPAEEKWLVEKIDYVFDQILDLPSISETELKKLQTLVDALNVLGLNGAAHYYGVKLGDLKTKLVEQ